MPASKQAFKPRGERKRYPPLVLLCVDAAGAVWALPERHDDRTEARTVGIVASVRKISWAWQTDWNGRSVELFPSPAVAGQALIDVLNEPWTAEARRAAAKAAA